MVEAEKVRRVARSNWRAWLRAAHRDTGYLLIPGKKGTATTGAAGAEKDKIDPLVFYVGGRWHFAHNAALTMRLGYPAFSVGVSFFL